MSIIVENTDYSIGNCPEYIDSNSGSRKKDRERIFFIRYKGVEKKILANEPTQFYFFLNFFKKEKVGLGCARGCNPCVLKKMVAVIKS